jgi:CRISPR/Cas system endoribonuclease Cas6 (RAMP superfamily)
VDYLPLVREAAAHVAAEPRLRWYDWGRRSVRQKRSMRLGGVLGEIQFSGPVGPFLPLLRAGEIVHAGKACTFGLGQYRISEGKASP